MYEFDAGECCANEVTVRLSTGVSLSLAQVEVFSTGELGKQVSLNNTLLGYTNDIIGFYYS